jgi:predicted transcriptional regulator
VYIFEVYPNVVQDVTCRIITQAYSPLVAQMKAPKVAEVLSAVSDDSSLELFKLIAQSNCSSIDLKSKTHLTRKQYYSRLNRLTKCGLVRRMDKVYSLTTLGKVLFDAETTIEDALGNFWRIKAIDSLEASEDIPAEEQRRLIEALLKDGDIKTILAK